MENYSSKMQIRSCYGIWGD